MKRKRAPRLAAAFVVTISAGCGGAAQEPKEPEDQSWVPNLGSVNTEMRRNEDGTCSITHPANPPWVEQVDCETREPIKKPAPEAP